ncbi:MAG TPA: tRNA pseudouridine(55) synthase, partial [Planctomycetota bacterium]|nr:tRNA pseudouridine(55) synthase [Planctomycetota bacterium]
MREPFDPSGVLIIDKPAGMTSHDVVDRLRDTFGWKKVGHAGTLDPLATGVLILLVGAATRAQSRFLNDDKEYRGRMKLGVETSTHDAEGEVTARAEGPVAVGRAELDEAFAAFRGDVRQLPPMVSAVKHKGKPLYKY